jgi:hypothetical protein
MVLFKIIKSLKFKFLVFYFVFCLLPFSFYLYAQDSAKINALSKQIIEAKSDKDLYSAFEELMDLYFSRATIKSEGGIPLPAGKENKYNELVDFLNSLIKKKKAPEPVVNYYIALTRYYQLKYLEETQEWDEYFSNGNTYRDQITQSAQKAIDVTTAKDASYLYARLILWRFHRDQQDAFEESALADLMRATFEYSQVSPELLPLKDVADQLLSYGEKGKAKELYSSYVNKLVTQDIKDEELASIALGFYKEGNPELSQLVYDIYIEKILKTYPKEKSIPLLIDIAKQFSYSAIGGKDEGLKDTIYAENIFKKIEGIGGKDAFDQELIYLRAFNLEKSKEYSQALNIYIDLIQRFPQGNHTEKATYKAGIIFTYILRDLKNGENYFEKLMNKESFSSYAISSLYQLGLLSQWEGDLIKAKEYYNKLLGQAKEKFQETVNLAKARLKEIEGTKPLEYNLKTFLDASLKEENKVFDMSKVDLTSSPYKPKKDQEVDIGSSAYLGETGCMQVEPQYLWSGDLGTNNPSSLEQHAFNTTYTEPGTKAINLVVVSPSGIIDRNIDLIDVD